MKASFFDGRVGVDVDRPNFMLLAQRASRPEGQFRH